MWLLLRPVLCLSWGSDLFYAKSTNRRGTTFKLLGIWWYVPYRPEARPHILEQCWRSSCVDSGAISARQVVDMEYGHSPSSSLSLSLYIYILCSDVYIHTYIHIYIYVQIYIYICVCYIDICTYIYIYVHLP